jgi:hypothetical protein
MRELRLVVEGVIEERRQLFERHCPSGRACLS